MGKPGGSSLCVVAQVESVRTTARERVLIRGLVDWVALDRVHWEVLQDNKDESVAVVQRKTLDLIRSLAEGGLVEVGDLSGDDGQFVAWRSSIDASIARISDAYVENFDDLNSWPWICWLDLTDAGANVARDVEARCQSAG